MNILSEISAIGTLDFEDLNKIILSENAGLSNYEVNQKRRNLSALGHLHIDYKKRKVIVMRPSFLPLPKTKHNDYSRVVLAGFRNQHLLSKLLKEAGKRKIVVQQDKNQEYPERILFNGELNEIQRLASDLKDFFVHSFSDLSSPTAWRLLHELDTVSDKIEQHTRVRQPVRFNDEIKNLMVYSPEKNGYYPWLIIKDSYKWSLMLIRLTIYKHWLAKKNSDGCWEVWQNDLQGDLAYAKWAIIQSLNNSCVKALRCAERGSFSVPIQYPLPQEYHRAACLCSGLVPYTNNGNLLYHEVPEVMRLELMNKLQYVKR
jgi:hypothetical protein